MDALTPEWDGFLGGDSKNSIQHQALGNYLKNGIVAFRVMERA